jgi:hypothetical protein
MKQIERMALFVIIAAGIAMLAAFTLFSAACLYDSGLPLCGHPAGGWIVVLLAAALVLTPAAWAAARRVAHLAGRTGRARPVAPARLQSLSFVVQALWPNANDNAPDHPANYFNETMEVKFNDGDFTEWTHVVDWGDFWQFCNDAWARQRRYEAGEMGEGPLSSRYWVPKIGRETWEAYLEMLRAGSALRGSPHKPLLRGTPWSVFEAVRARWC